MHFFQRYLEANDSERIESRNVTIGRDNLSQIGLQATQLLPAGCGIWVLSDENTEGVAGAIVRRILEDRGFRVGGPPLPAAPKPVPTIDLCDDLSRAAAEYDLIVAVGSGTLSDIGKKMSADIGIPNWSVPTAPSVDAFASAKSALRIRGYHRTPFVTPSSFILCDLSVLEGAPVVLRQAGVGDLLAKYFSYLDWTLSSWINGEAYDAGDARFALQSAQQSVAAVSQADGFGGQVSEAVIDAAITSGLIMQKWRQSRAAASAEHTIAHFWEVSGAVRNSELDLHGILVAAASRIALAAYTWVIDRLPSLSVDPGSLVAAYRLADSWSDTVSASMEPYRDKMNEEMADRDFSPEDYERRVLTIAEKRDEISDLASPILAELAGAVATLQQVDFPLSPADLGLDRQKAVLSVEHVRFLRNRYGIFDIAADLGLFPELLEYLRAMISQR